MKITIFFGQIFFFCNFIKIINCFLFIESPILNKIYVQISKENKKIIRKILINRNNFGKKVKNYPDIYNCTSSYLSFLQDLNQSPSIIRLLKLHCSSLQNRLYSQNRSVFPLILLSSLSFSSRILQSFLLPRFVNI